MPKQQINVRLIAPDAELDFSIAPSTTGKQLFDQVAKTVGLREVWYFGISFYDAKGNPDWLKLNKKVLQQNIKKEDPLVLRLEIKFFPEDVDEELIQDITKKYFFLQLRDAIVSSKIYCPPETCTLLASYACQVKYGDYEHDNQLKETDRLLPAIVLEKHTKTTEEWKETIINWWKEHRDMLREDAMLEYLKIVQDLEQYGVNFFDINNRKGTGLNLGIDALGLNVYQKDNMLNPMIGFPWSEIRNISFNDKKFIIKPIDRKAPDFIFFTNQLRTNKRILALCMGNHELYMRRRKADTIEVQQMRATVKDEKEAKLNEKRQVVRLRSEKETSIRRKNEADEQLRLANEQAEEARIRQREAEENFLSMQLKMQEEKEESDKRMQTLMKQVYEQESSMKDLESHKTQVELDLAMAKDEYEAKNVEDQERSKVEMLKLQDEKQHLEQQIHLRNIEQQRQKDEFDLHIKEREQELSMMRLQQDTMMRQATVEEEVVVVSADMAHSENIQGDRSEEDREINVFSNVEKSKKLELLAAELQKDLKEGGASQLDTIHMENLKQGRDKYKTLKQIRMGNTKSRVEQFENQSC